jgi:hypothetical protein
MPNRVATAPFEGDMTVFPSRKSRVVHVGHLVGDHLFGAERSLLELSPPSTATHAVAIWRTAARPRW